mgnify:CR=1 FL=1
MGRINQDAYLRRHLEDILVAVSPYKQEISNPISYLSYQMDKLGVRVELNKEATLEAILEEKADEVIEATGALPSVPDMFGVEVKNVVVAVGRIGCEV